MTLVLDIIKDAYREGNVVALGATPRDVQITEGFTLLSRVVSSALGTEVGEPLYDWPIGTVGIDVVAEGMAGWSQYQWKFPPFNARLVCNVNAATSLTFPVDPDDGTRMALIDLGGNLGTYPVTINGNGRLIEGTPSIIVNTNGASLAWLYRADLGNWVRLAPLEMDSDSEMPYPPEFDGYFTTMLAMRLNPRYGRAAAAETVEERDRVLGRLRSRYRQKITIPVDLGVRAMTQQIYSRWIGNGQRMVGSFPNGWMG